MAFQLPPEQYQQLVDSINALPPSLAAYTLQHEVATNNLMPWLESIAHLGYMYEPHHSTYAAIDKMRSGINRRSFLKIGGSMVAGLGGAAAFGTLEKAVDPGYSVNEKSYDVLAEKASAARKAYNEAFQEALNAPNYDEAKKQVLHAAIDAQVATEREYRQQQKPSHNLPARLLGNLARVSFTAGVAGGVVSGFQMEGQKESMKENWRNLAKDLKDALETLLRDKHPELYTKVADVRVR